MFISPGTRFTCFKITTILLLSFVSTPLNFFTKFGDPMGLIFRSISHQQHFFSSVWVVIHFTRCNNLFTLFQMFFMNFYMATYNINPCENIHESRVYFDKLSSRSKEIFEKKKFCNGHSSVLVIGPGFV